MDLDPLSTHLEPTFGDIDSAASWTDELKAAVKHHLTQVAPDELYTEFLGYVGHGVPPGTREAQADFILAHYSLWDVASGFHDAAVVTVPTFEQLADQIETAPATADLGDAALWLDNHATEGQITQMALRMILESEDAWLQIKGGLGHRTPDAHDLAEQLTLSQLRSLWDQVKFEQYRPTVGRRKRHTTKPRPGQGVVSPSNSAQVRRWAREHGHQVGDRGRIPVRVIEAFEAVHSF